MGRLHPGLRDNDKTMSLRSVIAKITSATVRTRLVRAGARRVGLCVHGSDYHHNHEDHEEEEELVLPLGYRFSPRNHELVLHYLVKKILGEFKYGKPNEAYFFSQIDQRHAKGGLIRRTTKSGYWKATGRETNIFYKKKLVGFKRIFIFHFGKAPTGKKTPWIMHEFRVNPTLIPAANNALDNAIRTKVESYVVCKIHYKELVENKKSSKPKTKKIQKMLEETK
ncbi:hypothetical protein JRO89_XS14G0170100 [Xanthoceras sorbifolium]|uniref:NAC domain-containing protein n=1 Tax=Xanthoceras sorbifolium TaxID=99658 RepID=A0ABQ8H5K8_9ROSI|nr:hypothetical protein JRO89_XS14G0170100 [Xanthoceras sorbifolium]